MLDNNKKLHYNIVIKPKEIIMAKKKAPKTEQNVETTYFKPAEIHIYLNEDGTLRSEVKNLNFDLMLRMTIPFLVNKAQAVYKVAAEQKTPNTPALTEAQLKALKEDMYDTMNIAFSNALDMFAPEIEARPNLSADAIYRAQQELLKEEMEKLGYKPEAEKIVEAEVEK